VIAYSGSSADVVATLKADPKWQALKAAKGNAIYAFPADYYSWDQPDPRWVLGLDWLAAKIHPEIFPSFSMDTAARGLYKDLYGLDDATYDKLVKPNLTGSF
jgi:iron complex transport system substrate-binding protein